MGTTRADGIVRIAFDRPEVRNAFRPHTVDELYRALDHQATLGAFVGRIALKDGRGTMVEWRYADGAALLPGDEEVRRLRPDAAAYRLVPGFQPIPVERMGPRAERLR